MTGCKMASGLTPPPTSSECACGLLRACGSRRAQCASVAEAHGGRVCARLNRPLHLSHRSGRAPGCLVLESDFANRSRTDRGAGGAAADARSLPARSETTGTCPSHASFGPLALSTPLHAVRLRRAGDARHRHAPPGAGTGRPQYMRTGCARLWGHPISTHRRHERPCYPRSHRAARGPRARVYLPRDWYELEPAARRVPHRAADRCAVPRVPSGGDS
jgi:hypothetical protein